MRKRWLILATFLGALTGATAWMMPRAPLCRIVAVGAHPGGFSPDSRVLFTSESQLILGASGHLFKLVVCQWDSRTGRLVQKTELPGVGQGITGLVHASTDGSQALVGEPQNSFESKWYLHEVKSGRRLSGPIPGVSMAPFQPFSPDRHWFIGLSAHVANGRFAKVSIHSALTGDQIGSAPGLPGRSVAPECWFAPDSGSVAVLWHDRTMPGIVQIIELPSGRELHRFTMPKPGSFKVKRWDGRQLVTAARSLVPGTLDEVVQGWRFEATLDGPGEGTADPELRVQASCHFISEYLWHEGPGWVVHVSPHVESNLEKTINKCKAWLSDRLSMKFHVLFADVSLTNLETRKTRFFRGFPSTDGMLFSDDARLLAYPTSDGQIEVWDTDPPSRLPAAMGTGAVVGGLVLALGRWNAARRMRKHDVSR